MITLVGCEVAKTGNSFIFQGPSPECSDCRFKATCIDTLEEGRKYKITNIKDSQLKCKLTDSTVIPVEVVLADIEMLFDSRKVFEGSNFIYSCDCEFKDCTNYNKCFPEGLHEGDKIIIARDLRESTDNCKKNKVLKKILARF